MRSLIGFDGHCNMENLPNVTLVFGGDKYTFEPKDYVVEVPKTGKLNSNMANCALNIFPVDVKPPKGPLFILGALFFKKYYTIFDLENHQIGFSTLRSVSQTNYDFEDYITNVTSNDVQDRKELKENQNIIN